MEELVGEFFSEHEMQSDPIVREPDGTFVVRGDLPIRDIRRELELDLEEPARPGCRAEHLIPSGWVVGTPPVPMLPGMSTTKQLPRDQWNEYFDRFTKEHLKDDKPEAATIEVISPTLGDQFEVTAMRLLGLSYDPKSETFEVLLEQVDHLVFQPAEIWVLEGEPGFIATLEVVSREGIKEIIYIRRGGPLAPHYQFPVGGNARRAGGDDRSGPANRR